MGLLHGVFFINFGGRGFSSSAGDNDRAVDHFMDAMLWSNQSTWLEHHLISARAQLGEENFAASLIGRIALTDEQAGNHALAGKLPTVGSITQHI
jgi:hypothetical protein